MGGPRMEAAGVRIVARIAPVVGLVEILRSLGGILAALRTVRETIRRERPDVLVLIDNPDFNLRVAPEARRLGLRTVYYVSPQVWAWRRGRVRRIARLADAMAVILPFEKAIYEAVGLRTEYVGHPVMERIASGPGDPAGLRRELGLPGDARVLAVLPGSRSGEIANHIELVDRTLELLARRDPSLHFVIPVAEVLGPESRGRIEALSRPNLHRVGERSHDVFRIAEAALVASGTASFEAAVIGVPTVVFYRLNRLTYRVGRLLIRVPHVSLANLLLGYGLIPEFIQDAARPEALADAVMELLERPERRRAMQDGFEAMRRMLGRGRASENAARLVAEVAGWRPEAEEAAS